MGVVLRHPGPPSGMVLRCAVAALLLRALQRTGDGELVLVGLFHRLRGAVEYHLPRPRGVDVSSV